MRLLIVTGAIAGALSVTACGTTTDDVANKARSVAPTIGFDSNGPTLDLSAAQERAQIERFRLDLRNPQKGYLSPLVQNLRVTQGVEETAPVMKASFTLKGCKVRLELKRPMGSSKTPTPYQLDGAYIGAKAVKLPAGAPLGSPPAALVAKYVLLNSHTFQCDPALLRQLNIRV